MSPEFHPLEMGFFLLFMGMTVVFAALITLMFALKLIRHLDDTQAGARGAAAAAPSVPAVVKVEPEVSGVVLAAIATTLLLDAQHVEDEERLVLTMRAMPKPYSVWWQGRMARAEMWRPHVTQTRAEALRAPQLQPDRQA